MSLLYLLMIAPPKKLTQAYSRYPCGKTLMERVFVKVGQGLVL